MVKLYLNKGEFMISKEEFILKVKGYVEFELSKSHEKQKELVQKIKKLKKRMVAVGSVGAGVLALFPDGFIAILWMIPVLICLFIIKMQIKQFINIKKQLNEEKKALFAFCLKQFELEADNQKINENFIAKSNLYAQGVIEDGFKGKGRFQNFYVSETYNTNEEGEIKYKLILSIPYVGVNYKTVVYNCAGFQNMFLMNKLKKVALNLNAEFMHNNRIESNNEDEAGRLITHDFIDKLDKVKGYFAFLVPTRFEFPRIDASFFDNQLVLVIDSDTNLFEFFDTDNISSSNQVTEEEFYGLFYDAIEAVLKTVQLFEK